jgi:hypothetical protein
MKLDKYLYESTNLDSGFISSDDDTPTGTTVFGEKMVPETVPNRLTGGTKNWKPDGGDWNYGEFENSKGMGSEDAYSDTLDSLESLLGDRVWRHTSRKKIKLNPNKMDKRDDSEIDQSNLLSDDPNDEFVEAPEQEVSEMDILEKITGFVNEDELTAVDRRNITKAIMSDKSMKFNVKNMKLDVKITDMRNGTKFEYPENTDFTLALVDIADTLGMDFDEQTRSKKTVFTMKG